MHEALCRFNSSAAPMSRFVFAVRCDILSPTHAIWFRAEYRPSPSVAPWRSLPHPAKSESLNLLSLFVSLCRAIRRVIPVPLLRRYRALEPRSARRMCNEGLSGIALHSPNCLSNQSHPDLHCTLPYFAPLCIAMCACGSVGSTGPTVLPIRKEPLALAYDPLDNRKIAFGVVRFALRRFP